MGISRRINQALSDPEETLDLLDNPTVVRSMSDTERKSLVDQALKSYGKDRDIALAIRLNGQLWNTASENPQQKTQVLDTIGQDVQIKIGIMQQLASSVNKADLKDVGNPHDISANFDPKMEWGVIGSRVMDFMSSNVQRFKDLEDLLPDKLLTPAQLEAFEDEVEIAVEATRDQRQLDKNVKSQTSRQAFEQKEAPSLQRPAPPLKPAGRTLSADKPKEPSSPKVSSGGPMTFGAMLKDKDQAQKNKVINEIAARGDKKPSATQRKTPKPQG